MLCAYWWGHWDKVVWSCGENLSISHHLYGCHKLVINNISAIITNMGMMLRSRDTKDCKKQNCISWFKGLDHKSHFNYEYQGIWGLVCVHLLCYITCTLTVLHVCVHLLCYISIFDHFWQPPKVCFGWNHVQKSTDKHRYREKNRHNQFFFWYVYELVL